jgi:hypothetical protein
MVVCERRALKISGVLVGAGVEGVRAAREDDMMSSWRTLREMELASVFQQILHGIGLLGEVLMLEQEDH